MAEVQEEKSGAGRLSSAVDTNFSTSSRDRNEVITSVMEEEIDIIRREVKQLRPRKIMSNGLRDAASSTVVACILQFAAFSFPSGNPFGLTWGTAVTFMILSASIIAFSLSFVIKSREIEDDDFEERKGNILQDLSRIDKKEAVQDHESVYSLPPAKHWWEKVFRRLCGID